MSGVTSLPLYEGEHRDFRTKTIVPALFYKVGNNYYDMALNRANPRVTNLTQEERSIGETKLFHIMDITVSLIQQMTSLPVLIATDYQFIMYVNDNGRPKVIYSRERTGAPPNPTLSTKNNVMYQEIVGVPNLARINSSSIYEQLPALDLKIVSSKDFDDLYSLILQLADNLRPLSSIESLPAGRELLAQLSHPIQRFNQPKINGQPVYLLSFNQIAQMMNSGQIRDFKIFPEIQSWSPGNNLGVFYAQDGKIYLVVLRYDQNTNQINPPV